MFAGSGPDTPRAAVRFFGRPSLVGADESLAAIALLDVGPTFRRANAASPWEIW